MNEKITPHIITCIALAAGINIVGGHIALLLKLPIYLDCMGTIVAGAVLGPVYGMIPGMISGLITGVTGDIYSIYFLPVQIVTGVMAGLLFQTKWIRGKRMPIGTLALTLPGTFVSAVISTILFGGVTSSGSSIIVLILRKLGVSMIASVFAVQIFTDYADRLLAVMAAFAILKKLPQDFQS